MFLKKTKNKQYADWGCQITTRTLFLIPIFSMFKYLILKVPLKSRCLSIKLEFAIKFSSNFHNSFCSYLRIPQFSFNKIVATKTVFQTKLHPAFKNNYCFKFGMEKAVTTGNLSSGFQVPFYPLRNLWVFFRFYSPFPPLHPLKKTF